MDAYARAARSVAEDLERVLHQPPIPTDPVSIDRFPHLDAKWFAATAAALGALGFAHLRDLDATAIVSPGSPPAMLRVFAHPEGTSCAAAWHAVARSPGFVTKLLLRLLGKWIAGVKAVELTSYGDDRIVSTSNQGTLNLFSPPPWMSMRSLPLGAPPDAVWTAHRAHLAESGVRPDALHGFDALHRVREQYRERANRWRREVGLLEEELDRMLAPHGKGGVTIRPHIVRELESRGWRLTSRPR